MLTKRTCCWQFSCFVLSFHQVDIGVLLFSNSSYSYSSSSLKSQLDKLWKQFLEVADQSVSDYLSVEHLGIILENLAKTGSVALYPKLLS